MMTETAGTALKLKNDEALVLFGYLTQFLKSKYAEIRLHDSERIVLEGVVTTLEEALTEPFLENYLTLLEEARAAVAIRGAANEADDDDEF